LASQARALATRANAVIATTAQLAALVNTALPPVVIPNGVDVARYRAGRAAPLPSDLADVPAPRAVYIGALHEWFDFDLLADVARRLPRLSFVLLGFHSAPLPPLPSNVHFLGSRPWQDLPRYLAACAVGIIPFRVNDLTLHVDPLKFYEYLASDLPCVSTPMHTLEQYQSPGVLTLAATPDAFAQGVEEALAAKAIGAPRRTAIADAHDWGVLARQFERVLERTLHEH
jgi:glycosyltransferase involved in cell wall biosynthesis